MPEELADIPDADHEWFDVVDEQDRFVRSAPRSEVHREGLLHRAVHIWVFTADKKLLIHRRTATKTEEPSKRTSSACGHVSSGETYEQAALRELQEELGLRAELRFLHKIPSGPEIGYEHTSLYCCLCDEPPIPDPREIESFEYLSISKIKHELEKNPTDFTNPFRLLFNWYVQEVQSERQ